MRASGQACTSPGCERIVIRPGTSLYQDRNKTQLLTTTLSHPNPRIAVCAAAGEVDIATAQDLRDQLSMAMGNKPRHLVVDLSAVTFFSAAGVGTLHTARAAQDDDQQLVLVATGRSVVRVLDICQVPYPRYSELDHALAACGETTSP